TVCFNPSAGGLVGIAHPHHFTPYPTSAHPCSEMSLRNCRSQWDRDAQSHSHPASPPPLFHWKASPDTSPPPPDCPVHPAARFRASSASWHFPRSFPAAYKA